MKTPKNPYVYDSDRIVVLAKDVTSRDGPFTCPGCQEPMIVRKGEIKEHHFAHKSGCSTCTGGGESTMHAMAKERVAQKVAELHFQVKCPTCKSDSVFDFLGHVGATEHRLHHADMPDAQLCDPSKYYDIDVGVFKDGHLVAAIEICHTHPVPPEKWHAINSLVPIYELDTELELKRSPECRACVKARGEYKGAYEGDCPGCGDYIHREYPIALCDRDIETWNCENDPPDYYVTASKAKDALQFQLFEELFCEECGDKRTTRIPCPCCRQKYDYRGNFEDQFGGSCMGCERRFAFADGEAYYSYSGDNVNLFPCPRCGLQRTRDPAKRCPSCPGGTLKRKRTMEWTKATSMKIRGRSKYQGLSLGDVKKHDAKYVVFLAGKRTDGSWLTGRIKKSANVIWKATPGLKRAAEELTFGECCNCNLDAGIWESGQPKSLCTECWKDKQ